ncbi:MAG: hypothetical protein KF882_02875 [Bacteroidia bacterium]|nr:hypothetical protein [Bacteroidia bacterium]MCO5253746.1 hypothetical protein [Bacteroidota bacterium]
MTREIIIERTIRAINQLPEDKAKEISAFADFIIKRFEEQQLTEGLQKLVAQSEAFGFLDEEEDLYSESDLKEVFNG